MSGRDDFNPLGERAPSQHDAPALAHLRTPPHSIEGESSVLGALLLDNNAWDRVADLLTADDFYRYEHRLIFAAIAKLSAGFKPADVVTVFDALGEAQASEAGGLVYLNQLAQYVPSTGNIRRYAEIVRERSMLRKLVSVTETVAAAVFAPEARPAATLLDDAQRALASFDLGAKAGEWQSVDAGMLQLIDRIQAQADGQGDVHDTFVPTGLAALDEKLNGGMREGELYVVGARPSMGKSALSLTVGVHVALNEGHAVAYWSGEMPAKQVWARTMALKARIHLSTVKRGERMRDSDWGRFTESVETLRQIKLFVNDQSGMTIGRMRASARALKRQHNIKLLIVDYLGLMDGADPKQPRAYQLEDITKGLKGLAKELGIAVMLLVQVNRRAEERTDQMPLLSDLRDSGAIEQDADAVLFLHRPIKANPNLTDEWKRYARCSVAKLRDGEPGIIHLQYTGEHLLFEDWPEGVAVPQSRTVVRRSSPEL